MENGEKKYIAIAPYHCPTTQTHPTNHILPRKGCRVTPTHCTINLSPRVVNVNVNNLKSRSKETMTTIFSGVLVPQGSRFLRKSLRFCSNPNPNVRNSGVFRMDAAARVSTVSNGGGGVVRFTFSSALVIQKGDLTKWSIDGSSDAIVNPANERMLGGGGADGAIHRAAGPDLVEACRNVPEVRPGIRCPTGEARITPGFNLPASHVIHTVGPIYSSDSNPAASLASAYRNSLRVAKENNIQYVAFPAISCGVYGYPYDEAATVAISSIKEFQNDFKEVHFVLFSPDIYDIWLNKANELLKA